MSANDGDSWYSNTDYRANDSNLDGFLVYRQGTPDPVTGFPQYTPRVNPQQYGNFGGNFNTRINRNYWVGLPTDPSPPHIVSASGIYHLGVARDDTLTGLYGEKVGILLVDSTTPFIYDTVYVDRRAHKTIYEGCELAAAHGATVKRFAFEDADDLERLLKEGGPSPRLICLDGVNSMTGNAPDLTSFAALAREHDAILYVDDAHGFGVVGERSDDELSPYGTRGNSIALQQDRAAADGATQGRGPVTAEWFGFSERRFCW